MTDESTDLQPILADLDFTGQIRPRARYLRAHGFRWLPTARPSDIPLRDPMSPCWTNVAAVLTERPDLAAEYVEGSALRPDGSVHEHAWLGIPDHQVIDVTWPDAESCVYYGVPLSRTQLKAILKRAGPRETALDVLAREDHLPWKASD